MSRNTAVRTDWLADGLRVLIAVVLATAGTLKLLDESQPHVLQLAGLVEIALSFGLVWPARPALLALALAGLLFAGGLAGSLLDAWAGADELTCHCFGRDVGFSPWQHLLMRSLLLLAVGESLRRMSRAAGV